MLCFGRLKNGKELTDSDSEVGQVDQKDVKKGRTVGEIEREQIRNEKPAAGRTATKGRVSVIVVS